MHRLAPLFLLLLPLSASAGTLSITGKPAVSFFATGSPGFLDIEGVTSTVTLKDDGTNLTFTVPMLSVKTGIDSRDEHMNHKYVQVDQYPDASLTLVKSAVQWPATLAEKKTGKVTGQFTVHGKALPVDVGYSVQRSKTGYRVTAKFNYDASAHGIEIPDYLGVTVDPKQRAEVNLDLVDA